MSEIKVGDIIAVYSMGFQYEVRRFIHTVTEIKDDVLIADNYVDGINHALYFHRKQCRKLVKVKKCRSCTGTGHALDPETESVLVRYYPYQHSTCRECNGRGKVKCEREENKYEI